MKNMAIEYQCSDGVVIVILKISSTLIIIYTYSKKYDSLTTN